jgi:hypothetical protein
MLDLWLESTDAFGLYWFHGSILLRLEMASTTVYLGPMGWQSFWQELSRKARDSISRRDITHKGQRINMLELPDQQN